MRRAYRRPIADADLKAPMALYREGRSRETSMRNRAGLERRARQPGIPVPRGTGPGPGGGRRAYRISDLELASGCRFFCGAASRRRTARRGHSSTLSRPDELERQARRMLADPRSYNLASNFAGQWLGLRNLESFDRTCVSIRTSRQPSSGVPSGDELFVDSILREDRSVRDLIKADYTFLNERLAKHYGIPYVYGGRSGA